MKSLRTFCMLICLTLVCLWVSACQAAPQTPGTGTQNLPGTETSELKTATSQSALSIPDPAEGHERLIWSLDPSRKGGLNPLLTSQPGIGPTSLLYRPLMVLDPELHLTAGLLSHYEWVSNTTLKLTLPPQATWSDGMPMTAQDIGFTLDKIRELPETHPYAQASARIKGFQVLDDQSIEVTCQGSPRLFLMGLAPIRVIPKHIWFEGGPSTWSAKDETVKLVSSGPYKLLIQTVDGYILTPDTKDSRNRDALLDPQIPDPHAVLTSEEAMISDPAILELLKTLQLQQVPDLECHFWTREQAQNEKADLIDLRGLPLGQASNTPEGYQRVSENGNMQLNLLLNTAHKELLQSPDFQKTLAKALSRMELSAALQDEGALPTEQINDLPSIPMNTVPATAKEAEQNLQSQLKEAQINALVLMVRNDRPEAQKLGKALQQLFQKWDVQLNLFSVPLSSFELNLQHQAPNYDFALIEHERYQGIDTALRNNMDSTELLNLRQDYPFWPSPSTRKNSGSTRLTEAFKLAESEKDILTSAHLLSNLISMLENSSSEIPLLRFPDPCYVLKNWKTRR